MKVKTIRHARLRGLIECVCNCVKIYFSRRRSVLDLVVAWRVQTTPHFFTGGDPSGKRRRVTSGGLDRRLSARMGVGALFAQHAACSAASTRPPRARALGMPAARLPTWPGRAWLAPARHRSGAPEARFARCWLSPRRRFHVSPAQSGAETSRKCASSQLLMDLRREPSTFINLSAGPARPSGASFKRAV